MDLDSLAAHVFYMCFMYDEMLNKMLVVSSQRKVGFYLENVFLWCFLTLLIWIQWGILIL